MDGLVGIALRNPKKPTIGRPETNYSRAGGCGVPGSLGTGRHRLRPDDSRVVTRFHRRRCCPRSPAGGVGIGSDRRHSGNRRAGRRSEPLLGLASRADRGRRRAGPPRIAPNEDADAGFDQIDKNSFYDYVATLIKELPEREQTILALYDFENLTLREIASLPSLTEARISQILGKLLLTLKTRLNETRSLTDSIHHRVRASAAIRTSLLTFVCIRRRTVTSGHAASKRLGRPAQQSERLCRICLY